MPSSYEDAVKKLLELCEVQPGFGAVDSACLIRDLKGRLRLVVKPGSGATVDWSALRALLDVELSPWFFGPILRCDHGSPDARRLAQQLIQQHRTPTIRWPAEWPTELDLTLGAPATPLPSRWCGSQRLLTKESWLSSTPASPPWQFGSQTPMVISFFSFKGGVGRTTALALTAYHLSRSLLFPTANQPVDTRPVVLVDLDLEAPGLGALFGLPPGPGVIDALLEHSITGSISPSTLTSIVRTVNTQGVALEVITAGDLGQHHLEKLGRLDYLGGGQDGASPVGAALRALLEAIKARTPTPKFILIDARAGLHDLGGLALHGLSHADVLVGRDNEQGRTGMKLTLSALTRRRSASDLQVFPMLTFVHGERDDQKLKADRYFAYLNQIAGPLQLPLTPDRLIVIPDLGQKGAPADFSTAEDVLLRDSEYERLASSLASLLSPVPAGQAP